MIRKTSEHLCEILDSGRSLAVGILLFPHVEVLDFAGPFEVFSVANRVARRDQGREVPPFSVTTVAASREVVLARHGLSVLPRHSFNDAPQYDVLVVPGGVVTQPMNDAATLDYVQRASSQASLTASVCTGAFILAKTDIIRGQRVTTHWEDIADLRQAFPSLAVVENVPFVEAGDVITSAGISAGIGMSLHMVSRILGEKIALSTAKQMQYDWKPITSSAQ